MKWVSCDPENNVAANDSTAPIVTGINNFLMAQDPFESDTTNHDKDIKSNAGRVFCRVMLIILFN